ncbi:PREDICTED: leucine-rich repeat-containing protein 20 isoform X1 [Calidris pugnax]|uniref:leucine-rich repeat-containing protein 20 isoform X1 n=1 Tax=Calidris pugnax TaxID=198806 RepID=UPI00071CA39C|nr:PREDICTED: leucine-rich repeat-containing protein 20 isoform X1 [Calidris pugnax]
MQKRMGEAVARVARKVNDTVENKTDSLDLANCKLIAFPVGIYKAMRSVTEGIHHISLANNELKSLTSRFVTTFSQLRELNLAGNYLHRLPEEVTSLLHLRVINLSRNRFRHFPEPLTTVTTLETIDLEENEITGEKDFFPLERCQWRSWPPWHRCGASTCGPTLSAPRCGSSSGPSSPSTCCCHQRNPSPKSERVLGCPGEFSRGATASKRCWA